MKVNDQVIEAEIPNPVTSRVHAFEGTASVPGEEGAFILPNEQPDTARVVLRWS